MPVDQQTYDIPRTHLALANPEEWNAQWEELLALGVFNPQMIMTNYIAQAKARRATVSEVMDQAAFLYTVTCELQYRIGVRAVNALNNHDFERRWLEAGVDIRRKHALRGLSEACAMARNLNDSRAACYDVLRLDYLSETGPTFITLLKDLIPEDISDVPKTAYYVPNKEWEDFKVKLERLNAPNTLPRAVFDDTYILRTKLIYHVVEFIFMSFLDMPLNKVTVQKSSGPPVEIKKAIAKQEKASLRKTFGPEMAKEIFKDDREAWKDRKAGRGVSCAYRQCGKHEEPGEKFKRCAKCYDEQGRVCSYCSRECQVKDWKESHKAICGKQITSEMATQAYAARRPTNAPEARQVGPTRDGFRRSPALVEHVHRLNTTPTADLFLRVGPSELIPLDAPFRPIQDLVRQARDQAMCAGDAKAAAKLCHYHLWISWAGHRDERMGWDFNVMLEQMEREFEQCSGKLKNMILELEDIQEEDPYQRPLLVAQLAPVLWLQYVHLDALDMDRKLPFERDTPELPDGMEMIEEGVFYNHDEKVLIDATYGIAIPCTPNATIMRTPRGFFSEERQPRLWTPPPRRSTPPSDTSDEGEATISEVVD
ncbi:hypothetical protein AAF712_014463 [Marasmius tenuissimus]|uniref:MYND-type domain-containing protein n=1 Tax=Marasmius tenuissimus TaxID=585030 RepID=A0ABR2ZB05_9AGAR